MEKSIGMSVSEYIKSLEDQVRTLKKEKTNAEIRTEMYANENEKLYELLYETINSLDHVNYLKKEFQNIIDEGCKASDVRNFNFVE